MFDTCALNALLDAGIDVGALWHLKGRVFVTHVQLDEINNTKDEEKRKALLDVFQEATTGSVPTESLVLGASKLGGAKLGGDQIVSTESAVWGVSKFGQSKWTSHVALYAAIKEKLDKVNNGKKNNIQDALIAETAMKNKYILVTQDADLFRVVTFFKGAVCNLQSLLSA